MSELLSGDALAADAALSAGVALATAFVGVPIARGWGVSLIDAGVRVG